MRKLLTTALVAAGLVLSAPTAASARPVIDEPVYCGPGYYVSQIDGTCKPRQTNDCVVWWQPWTWARTTCV